MAQVTITIPNNDLTAVVTALAPDWTAQIENEQGELISNPINRNEAARQRVIQLVKADVKRYKEQLATAAANATIESARVAALTEANAINIT